MKKKESKMNWKSKERRIENVLRIWKEQTKAGEIYSSPDEYLQRISNIIGVKA